MVPSYELLRVCFDLKFAHGARARAHACTYDWQWRLALWWRCLYSVFRCSCPHFRHCRRAWCSVGHIVLSFRPYSSQLSMRARKLESFFQKKLRYKLRYKESFFTLENYFTSNVALRWIMAGKFYCRSIRKLVSDQ